MESVAYKSKFMKQISSSFGSGGMALAFSEVEFQCFILYLKSTNKQMPIRKAATIIGLQPHDNFLGAGKGFTGKILLFSGLFNVFYLHCTDL